MTNGQFYGANKNKAFDQFCKGTKGPDCSYCFVQREIHIKGIKTSDCKNVWLDMPHVSVNIKDGAVYFEHDRTQKVICKLCPVCGRWKKSPVSDVYGACSSGVTGSGTGNESGDKCVWFLPRDEKAVQSPIDVACVHREGSIDGPDLHLCNHPANLRGTRCDYNDVRDCFLSGKIRLTPEAPASDAPAPYVSVRVPEFEPKLTGVFESIEKRAYHRGLLIGLKEVKRYLEFVAAINATSPDCACLKADAENKLEDVKSLIVNAERDV